LYESPFRVLRLMEDIAEIDPMRYTCVGREMTKVHEEYIRGTAGEVLAELSARKELVGEFSVFVGGSRPN